MSTEAVEKFKKEWLERGHIIGNDNLIDDLMRSLFESSHPTNVFSCSVRLCLTPAKTL